MPPSACSPPAGSSTPDASTTRRSQPGTGVVAEPGTTGRGSMPRQFDAIGQPDIFRTELVGAGGLAILLALTADALLTLVQRALTPWSRLR